MAVEIKNNQKAWINRFFCIFGNICEISFGIYYNAKLYGDSEMANTEQHAVIQHIKSISIIKYYEF